jgi:teichuronic acid exporter
MPQGEPVLGGFVTRRARMALSAGEVFLRVRVHDKLLVGLRSYASVRLLTQITSWAGTIYVVRHLDSHAFGQYAVALVVFNYLAMVFDGTLLEAIVQQPPTTVEARRAAFSLLVGTGVLLIALTTALAGPIGSLVGDPSVTPLIMGIAAALGLTSLCILPQASLAREMDFPRLASIGAVQAVCVTLSTVGLAAAGAGAWALVSGQIVGAAVRAVLLNVYSPGLMWPTVRLEKALHYVRFGGVLFADNVLWRWYTSLDTFLLGRWSGTTELGFYNLAQQVAELPLEKISTVVNDISLPAYAELRSDPPAAANLLLETIRTQAIIGFPIFWGLAAVAVYAVPVLFGSRWGASVFPLMALAGVAPLRLIGSIETPAMTGIGRPAVLVKTKLIIAPCMTVALAVGCWFWGIKGAALAWLGMFPICYGWTFRYVLQAAGIRYRQLLEVIRGPAAAAAAMICVVLACQRLTGALTDSSLAVLAVSIAGGALSYALGLRLLDPVAFRLAEARFGRFVGLQHPA